MKKFILLVAFFAMYNFSFAQDSIPNRKAILEALERTEPHITIEGNTMKMTFLDKEYKVSKGDEILIGLPVQGSPDFIFIEKKKGLLNAKLLGAVADVAATAAVGVALSSHNYSTVLHSIDAFNKAAAISDIAYSVDNLQNLAISKKSKAIAGKKAVITSIKHHGDDYIIDVNIDKKAYSIKFPFAVLLEEIKLAK